MIYHQMLRFYLLALLLIQCDASSNGNQNPSQWSSSSYYREDERQNNPPPLPQETNSPDPRQQSYSSFSSYNNRQESSSEYVPIDYEFKARDAARPPYGEDEVPETMSPYNNGTDRRSNGDDSSLPTQATASARRDAIARYMGNFRGRASLRTSTALVGMAIGSFLGQSLFNTPRAFGIFCSVFFVFLTLFRGPYGELSKALGLTLIFVWQRNFRIRRRYPTWPHVKSSLGIIPRRPFPRNDDYQTGEVSKIYTLIAMALVGSTCGGSLPLLPTWMGGLGGAALFVVGTLLPSARGDLCRSMGMRVVAVVEELLDINKELKVVQKSGVVAGLILDKILILDRKHNIKDRIGTGLTWIYTQVAQTAGKVDSERRENRRDDRERRENRRDSDRRDNSDRSFESRREQDRRPSKYEDKRAQDIDRRRPTDPRYRDAGKRRESDPRGPDRQRPPDDRQYSSLPRQEDRQSVSQSDDRYRPGENL
mmetsp:Transcript_15540/g.22918  ORF Transcript_15540/g.22918 Transcript_15540/m.22918 type:complete len:480 (-) Transcript_15540:55-1494(-)